MNEERFFRAYKALKDIETADDLRRAGLTLAEFREAAWFGLRGFSVQPQGIGWRIT